MVFIVVPELDTDLRSACSKEDAIFDLKLGDLAKELSKITAV
jgi:hypothetical protein